MTQLYQFPKGLLVNISQGILCIYDYCRTSYNTEYTALAISRGMDKENVFRMEFLDYQEEWSQCLQESRGTGDNCIKQIKIVSENRIYVFSHLQFLDFIHSHKIQSIKAELKLCGEQRKPMGRKGQKMILGRYGKGTSLMNNIFMYKGFLKQ